MAVSRIVQLAKSVNNIFMFVDKCYANKTVTLNKFRLFLKKKSKKQETSNEKYREEKRK